MSKEEADEVKITFKKWIIGAIAAFVMPLFICTGVIINFYYETLNEREENKIRFEESRIQLGELKDKLTRHEVSLNSKVSIEALRDIDQRMEREMRDIKNLLNILIEKK
jgi:hypothetical protein